MHQAGWLQKKGSALCAHLHGTNPSRQRASHNCTSWRTRCTAHDQQHAVPNAQRQQPALASSVRPASQQETSVSSSDPTSWSQRMASIQGLMSKVQEQMQQHAELQSKDPALSKKLKQKSEQHLDLLMQLAEAEQRHISGDMKAEELQKVLQDLQQQLDEEQQEALAALQEHSTESSASASRIGNTSSGAPSGHQLHVEQHSQQLGATAALKEAIHKASEGLNRRRQELQKLPQQTDAVDSRPDKELHERVEAAEASVNSTQQLLQDFDLMCQKAFELSRKLSLAEAENVELKDKLVHMKLELAAAADELAEHRELQMQYDTQCQDMYRLRMLLQQTQAAGNDVAAQAAGTASKHKKDIAWLMEAHRNELSEQYSKNQELTESIQELRMRLLEMEQQLWSQQAAGTSSNSGGSEAATSGQQKPQAEVDVQQQQPQQLSTALDAEAAVQQLTQEKQQLMKNLQDLQRQQAVLMMELQASQEQLAADSQRSGAAEQQAAEEASQAVVSLQQQLEESAEQRNVLIQQVQVLQQDLQEVREAAAAAAGQQAVAVVDVSESDSSALAAAEEELAGMKAQVVQLRGQLAETRRELQAVSGRVAAAETALQQQAAQFEGRLQQLQALYSKQTAIVAHLRQGRAPPPDSVGFRNTNRFWVPQQLVFQFLKHWVMREGQLQQQPGFLGLQVEPVPGISHDGGVDVVISSLWESIPLWESWSKSDVGRQQHMPEGVYQYVPRKGEGFPEDFVPFRDYDEAVNAKY